MRVARIAVLMLSCAVCGLRAETLSGNLLVRPDWSHKKTGVTTASESFSSLYNWTFTSGNSTNQMNMLWTARRTLTSGAADTNNVVGGIINSFGTTLTMATVRMIAVHAASTNLNTISVGGAAANTLATPFGDASDKVTLRPDGLLLLVAPDATGYAVSTNGNMLVTNDGTNSVSYDIYIGGSN